MEKHSNRSLLAIKVLAISVLIKTTYLSVYTLFSFANSGGGELLKSIFIWWAVALLTCATFWIDKDKGKLFVMVSCLFLLGNLIVSEIERIYRYHCPNLFTVYCVFGIISLVYVVVDLYSGFKRPDLDFSLIWIYFAIGVGSLAIYDIMISNYYGLLSIISLLFSPVALLIVILRYYRINHIHT